MANLPWRMSFLMMNSSIRASLSTLSTRSLCTTKLHSVQPILGNRSEQVIQLPQNRKGTFSIAQRRVQRLADSQEVGQIRQDSLSGQANIAFCCI